jgi:hypothetical protein
VVATAGADVVGAGVLRRLGGGALPSAAAAHWRSFSISAATGFGNQNREMVLPLSGLSISRVRSTVCCAGAPDALKSQDMHLPAQGMQVSLYSID